jgi:hypothetical protein
VRAYGGSHRTSGEQYRRRSALVSLTVLLAMVGLAACSGTAPALDRGGQSAQADGTISGTVRGPEGGGAIEGRRVDVVNVETGERQSAITSRTGGYTFRVKPGRYKVEFPLGAGESILRQPGTVNINRRDTDTHADFVVGGTRAFRPRPAFKSDTGLGSPIA